MTIKTLFRQTVFGLLLTGLCLLGSARWCGAQELYFELTDLGRPGDVSSEANAVNDAGVVVGSFELSNDGSTYRRGFYFFDGFRADDFESGYPHRRSNIVDINASGCAVGWSQAADLAPVYLEVWKAAASCPFDDTLYIGGLGGSYTSGQSINAAHQVVGVSETGSGEYHALELTVGQSGMTDLGTLAGGWNSAAFAINDAGETAGYSTSSTVVQTATLWTEGTPADLGAFPGSSSGTQSYAFAINNQLNPQVVGWSHGPDAVGHPHAFLWQSSVMTDLGTLPGGDWSEAYGINDYGDVVGWALGSDYMSYAVLWTGGQIVDLNTVTELPAGWTLAKARAINNLGQIVGRGVYQGADRAFLLTPVFFGDGFETGDFSGWDVVVP